MFGESHAVDVDHQQLDLLPSPRQKFLPPGPALCLCAASAEHLLLRNARFT
jgi:hypothetical protein